MSRSLVSQMDASAVARLRTAQASALTDTTSNIKAARCRPPQFGGFNGGFEGQIEFLFTPGRVTMLWEGGLVRRIFTDGRELPREIDDSRAGISRGRWDGQVLVVDTVDLGSRGELLPDFAVGTGARSTERIYLRSQDALEIDTTLTAPDLSTRPIEFSLTYYRDRNRVAQEFNWCVEDDRSLDPITGKARFDMTPPANLPPPPSE